MNARAGAGRRKGHVGSVPHARSSRSEQILQRHTVEPDVMRADPEIDRAPVAWRARRRTGSRIRACAARRRPADRTAAPDRSDRGARTTGSTPRGAAARSTPARAAPPTRARLAPARAAAAAARPRAAAPSGYRPRRSRRARARGRPRPERPDPLAARCGSIASSRPSCVEVEQRRDRRRDPPADRDVLAPLEREMRVRLRRQEGLKRPRRSGWRGARSAALPSRPGTRSPNADSANRVDSDRSRMPTVRRQPSGGRRRPARSALYRREQTPRPRRSRRGAPASRPLQASDPLCKLSRL